MNLFTPNREYIRVGIVLEVVLAAFFAGLLLGRWSAPDLLAELNQALSADAAQTAPASNSGAR